MGPWTTSHVSSNPVWVPNSDKIAYLEVVDYCEAQIVTSKTYRLELVLNIKSLSDLAYHKKITWVIPEDEWMDYRMANAHLSFSPQGDKIVFGIGYDIYIAELKDNSKFQKIINNGLNPEWSPDGKTIVYQIPEKKRQKQGFFTTDDGRMSVGRVDFSHPNWKEEKEIFMKKEIANGVILLSLLIGQKPKWSSDGSKIIFSASDKIFITDKEGKSIRWIKIPYKEVGDPSLSPDMGKVVFSKYRYEEYHYWLDNNIYIADINTGAILKEILKPNGSCANENHPIFDPVWSPNGEYIAYMYDCSSREIFAIKNDGSGLKQIAGTRSHYGWE